MAEHREVGRSREPFTMRIYGLLATAFGFVLGFLVALAPWQSARTHGSEVYPGESAVRSTVPIVPEGSRDLSEVDYLRSALSNELEGVRAALMALGRNDRTPVEPSNLAGEDEKTLEKILSSLARVESRFDVSGKRSPSSLEVLDRSAPVKRDEIHRLAEGTRVNRDQMEREVHLLTMAEAIERFGYPDRTGATHNSHYEMFWEYHGVNASGERTTLLELYFIGERVAGFNGNWGQ